MFVIYLSIFFTVIIIELTKTIHNLWFQLFRYLPSTIFFDDIDDSGIYIYTYIFLSFSLSLSLLDAKSSDHWRNHSTLSRLMCAYRKEKRKMQDSNGVITFIDIVNLRTTYLQLQVALHSCFPNVPTLQRANKLNLYLATNQQSCLKITSLHSCMDVLIWLLFSLP